METKVTKAKRHLVHNQQYAVVACNMEQKLKEPAQNILRKQPIHCPWTTSQPYPSTVLSKNPSIEKPSSKTWIMDSRLEHNSSMQQSSSQFFYFLRLMQLFPDTHPATLHTVLTLCKNDFFCAVDKLLYAKRCKIMFNKRQTIFQKLNREHPYSKSKQDGKECKADSEEAFDVCQGSAEVPQDLSPATTLEVVQEIENID